MPIAAPKLLLPVLVALTLTCATANPNAAKYPPRGRGCAIRVIHEAAPDVKAWDDLGIVHVDCPLDLGRVQCLRKLRGAACRMGGDLLYDVPKKPLRPTDEGMVYLGHVAHTRPDPDAGAEDNKAEDDEAEADGGVEGESTFEATGPVQPLPLGSAVPAAPPPSDGGARPDGGR